MMEFALSIKPSLLVVNLVWVAVACIAIFLFRKANATVRSIVFVVVATVLLNVATMKNPFFWKRLLAVSTPLNVGGQQYNVAKNHYQQMFKQQSSAKFLAVGSSQTEMLFGQLSNKREDLAVLDIPGMSVLDTWLFRHQISASDHSVVVFFLSDFDFGRAPQYNASRLLPISVTDGFYLHQAFRELTPTDDFPKQALMLRQAMIGKWLPAYRFNYLWRSLYDYYLGVNILTASGKPLPGVWPEAEVLITQSEKSSRLFDKAYFAFYRRLLSETLGLLAENEKCVVIIDGQYKDQIQRNGDLLRDTQSILVNLSNKDERVMYLRREELPAIPESKWIDINHVDFSYGEFYGGEALKLVERILSSGERREGFNPNLCTFDTGNQASTTKSNEAAPSKL